MKEQQRHSIQVTGMQQWECYLHASMRNKRPTRLDPCTQTENVKYLIEMQDWCDSNVSRVPSKQVSV